MKNKKGITLIALVITIVVLIILAGVAINMAIGQNGILNRAKFAKQEYSNAQTKEEIEIEDLEWQVDANSRNTVTIPKEEYDKLKNANKYSTEEIEIGTWIDGKPLYRKIYNFITPAASASDTVVADISNLDIDYIIHIYGTVDRGSTIGQYPIGQYYASGTLYAQAYTYDSNKQLYFGQKGLSSLPANIILEYTKTTDSAS